MGLIAHSLQGDKEGFVFLTWELDFRTVQIITVVNFLYIQFHLEFLTFEGAPLVAAAYTPTSQMYPHPVTSRS